MGDNYRIATMITKEQVSERIRAVAEEISRDYAGKEIHMICVLKGGVYFIWTASSRCSPECPTSLR